MRGRVSYISSGYSKTNSKFLKSYDPKQESKILYTYTRIIYTAMLRLHFCHKEDSDR